MDKGYAAIILCHCVRFHAETLSRIRCEYHVPRTTADQSVNVHIEVYRDRFATNSIVVVRSFYRPARKYVQAQKCLPHGPRACVDSRNATSQSFGNTHFWWPLDGGGNCLQKERDFRPKGTCAIYGVVRILLPLEVSLSFRFEGRKTFNDCMGF